MLRRGSLILLACAFATLSLSPLVGDEPAKPAKIAHIKISGDLGEVPAGESLFGGSSETFKNKLDNIAKAAKDANVKALYLEVGGLGVGMGKAHELRRAIIDFKKSGKKTYAYLNAGDGGIITSGGGKDYLVACACDEVAMAESESLLLTGVRYELSFYKDLLDKFGVKADMLQMGDFKGAGETYTRNSMSKQNREQWEAVAEDQYRYLVESIAESRKAKGFTVEKVKQIIDEGPFSARKAAALGLVDRLCYVDDFKAGLKAEKTEIVKNYGKPKAQDVDMSNPFALLKMFQPAKEPKLSKNPKIAVIVASGEIATGRSGAGFLGGETMGSTTMIDAIRKAEEEPTVKAIVLRIDSPGGSALASDLIWNELNKSKKPVIASMSDIAGSGGYYIACPAEKIFAEPGTITGSIGVVGGKIALGGLFDKFGVKTEVISRGANSGAYSTTTPFTESERKAIRAMMEDTYDQFLDRVLAGRKKAGKTMTKEHLLTLAGGHIYSGRQAKINGLVDELGTLEDALAYAKQKAGLKDDAELYILPKGGSPLDALIDRFSGGGNSEDTILKIAGQLGSSLPELATHFRAASALLRLRQEKVWTVIPYRIELK